VSEQLALLPEYLFAHLRLSLVALAIGVSLSLPLGVAATRTRRLEPWLLGLAGVIQTIPSLALLAIMVPALALFAKFSGVAIPSIGYLPAVVALSLYSALPILRNTVTGIRGVPRAVIDAADASGMTGAQRLRRVELPLALPIMVAGVRTATVWVVGTATLSTPVGATSLGNYIFTGLQTRNFQAVLVGCVAAAGLALVLDQLIHGLQRCLETRRYAPARVIAAMFLAAAGWSVWGALPVSGEARPLRVGTKAFTEQYILGELVGAWISDEGGRASRQVTSLGSTVAFDALRASEIDLYVDYSGTIWATIMGQAGFSERGAVLGEVEDFLREEHGIALVARLGFENTYALAVRSDLAKARELENLSDLAKISQDLSIGGDLEFFARTEWKALVATYGFRFREKRTMDPALMYQAAALGEVDAISAFSTDGRIAAYELAVLDDDRGVIPPYDTILLARPGFEEEFPGVSSALRRLEGRISAEAMREANLGVDRDERSPAAVARDLAAALRE
jgi:osmoprotectant transport system permease protein